LVDCGNAEIIKLPTEKADTDTFAAAKHGIKLGYKDFLILGGLSGRLDHTIANIQTLALLASEGCRAEIIDNKNRLKILMPGEIAFVEDSERYFSVYSFEREAVVTIKNAKWDLDMARLINRFPVGTSNEPLSPRSEVLCENGLVLVVISKD
jgi:thiamine pyrophosphokinase